MTLKKIRDNTFKELTMNVFMLLKTFQPESFDFKTGITASNIIASTTGGVTFTDAPEYTDFGEDIDNCPKNTMELKHKEDGEVTLSGTLVTLNPEAVQMLIGAADIAEKDTSGFGTGNEAIKITPRHDLKPKAGEGGDFIESLWGLADYGEGGLLAIKMNRVLNTSGFTISTTDQAKGTFAFTFTCHKSIEAQDDPAYEIYLVSPASEAV